jgi:hypothetical protein
MFPYRYILFFSFYIVFHNLDSSFQFVEFVFHNTCPALDGVGVGVLVGVSVFVGVGVLVGVSVFVGV